MAAFSAANLHVSGQGRGFDSLAELVEPQRLEVLLGGRDVLVTEHHLQAANIDRLEDVCGKRIAEFVQVTNHPCNRMGLY